MEGHHYGSVVALDADGSVAWSVGDVDSPVLPRSCNKPVQALGMVRAGLDLPPDLLALACASHSGEPFHVEGVRRILASAGLSEADLQTPPDYPLDDAAREQVIRDGGAKAPVLMNCSGKHAAMLATCVANGWPTDDLPRPRPPAPAGDRRHLRRADRRAGRGHRRRRLRCAAALRVAGRPRAGPSAAGLGVDAPAPARAPARIADAIRRHPAYVSGTTRDERALLTAIPGAIGKAGAECCYAVALADGRAFALKADDGAPRVRPVLMAEALRRSGVLDEAGRRRRGGAGDRACVELLGGGVPVGRSGAVYWC